MNAACGLWQGLRGYPSWLPSSPVVRVFGLVVVMLCNGVSGAIVTLETGGMRVSVCVFACVFVCVSVVWALALYSLLNIMKRSSPAFSRKKFLKLPMHGLSQLCEKISTLPGRVLQSTSGKNRCDVGFL
jgi:hypothetical protein